MYSIVQKLGGEVFNGGKRALIPGPGHSRGDRSISLLLGDKGKVRIHPFSDHDWREVMDWLKRENLVADDHTLLDLGYASLAAQPAMADREKIAVAQRIWEEGRAIEASPSARWLAVRRKITRSWASDAFRHGPRVPTNVYDAESKFHHLGFLAKVTTISGEHVATEVTYLDANARKATSLRIPRKLVGCKPAGAAVAIDMVEEDMVVAEGIPSALSASEHFGLPCHALLGVRSFPQWRPPKGVRRVIIAAERDPSGRAFSQRLYEALRNDGLDCQLEFAPDNAKDFNAFKGGKG